MKNPLPYKEIEFSHDWEKRVMFFDPLPVYERVNVNHYSRHPQFPIESVFPSIPGFCSCGCGKELTGRRKRWATDVCGTYAYWVTEIFRGNLIALQRYLRYYYGWKCQKCGCEDKGHDMGANGNVSWIKVDHIIPVKHGGGGWWLSNYQLICHDCHVIKTKEDFGWDNKNKNQIKLL